MMMIMIMMIIMMFMMIMIVEGFGPKKAKSTVPFGKSNEAIAIYRKLRDPSKIKSGGMFDKPDSQLIEAYKGLVAALKTDDDALRAVSNSPDVLLSDSSRITANWNVYESKWGTDKAKTVVINNPSLLSVKTTGYGSAEAASDETVYVSYLVALTRPAGPVLLSLLLLALGKAVVFGI